MDFVDRLSGRARTFDVNSLLKFTDLSPAVQKHLQKVYLTLTLALCVAAVGVYTHLVLNLGGLLSALGFMGATVWLMSTQPTPANLNKRYGLLAAAAFCQGLSLGPLVGAALALHPGVLLTAFLGTAAVFGCFSAAAMLSRRRSFLYLGGMLGAAVSGLALLRLGSWFMGGRALVFQAELYGGLLVFCGYVLFDTQLIIEKAYIGQLDHVRHALDLFVDAIAIFVRLVVILLQNAEKRDERTRRSNKRRA